MVQIVDTKAALAELSELIDTFVAPEKFGRWLDQQAKFHKYSFRNTLLIMTQNPEATAVAGFQTWLNKFGRCVRKGEKAIKILAPVPYEDKDEDGKVKSGVFFRAVSVFDVAQTDPVPGAKNVFVSDAPILLDDESGDDLYRIGVSWMTEDGCIVQSENAKNSAGHGWYSHSANEIYVRPAPNLRKLEVLIHEIAHRLQKGLDKKEDYGYAGNEVCVESAAYVVCKHFGLDVAMSAVPYVRSWLTEDRKAFERGLGTISRLSEKIIVELSKRQENVSLAS